jgi:hypothetical protein
VFLERKLLRSATEFAHHAEDWIGIALYGLTLMLFQLDAEVDR